MSPEEKNAQFAKLGAAMTTFVQEMIGYFQTGDDALRQVYTEKYRREVERLARKGIEGSLPWHTLATWAEEGKDRIGYFSRALECLDREQVEEPHRSATQFWARAHMRVECLYEIGRVHAHEGDPGTAREFLEKARSFIFAVDIAREEAIKEGARLTDDHLEGKIATLLLQLPEEGSAPAPDGDE
jgi:hypothetical protein